MMRLICEGALGDGNMKKPVTSVRSIVMRNGQPARYRAPPVLFLTSSHHQRMPARANNRHEN